MCGAEASCSPGEACGGGGCPSAARGCHTEQISCSHGGTHRAAVNAARRSPHRAGTEPQPIPGQGFKPKVEQTSIKNSWHTAEHVSWEQGWTRLVLLNK